MRIAIVTGASSGIGREFVFQLNHFYRNLDEIWVIARREDRLKLLSSRSGAHIRIFSGDLTKKAVFRELRQALEDDAPDVRMLVNAAGFGKSGTFIEIAGEKTKLQCDMIDLNCRALTRMTQTVLPYMKEGSRIINLASAAAFCPQPGFAVYAASKSYVLSFSRALGAELKQRHIVVTAVCPGPVDTEFFTVSGGFSTPLKKLFLAKAPAVVNKALKDSRAGKQISVYGGAMKIAGAASKLLPHSLILKAEELFTK